MRLNTVSLAGLAALAGTAAAQQGVSDLGAGCAGNFGTVVPTIGLSAPVVAGQSATVNVTGPVSGVAGIYVADCSDTYLGLPLPLDLATLDPVAFAGCTLYANVNLAASPFLVFLDANGEGSLSGTVADCGACFRLQGWTVDVLDPATPLGLTNGLEVETLAAGGTANAGDIIITEVMQNPSFVFDSNGEYFELYNTTGADIDIAGWTVADNDFDSFIINSCDPVIVPAGGYVTLGNNGDTAANGGIDHAYVYGGDMFLSNGADEVVVTDGAGTEIDRVEYDGGTVWPDPNGSSMSLDVNFLNSVDNDNGANWSVFDCAIGGDPFNTDDGTPGAVNDVCNTGGPPVATGDILFVEVMNNPGGVSDNDGEWFEIVNNSGGTIDLLNYTFFSGASSFTVDTSISVPDGGYVAFLRKSDPLVNGGIDAGALGILSFDYPDSWNMGNSGGTLQAVDASGTLVGELVYDSPFDDSGDAKQLPPSLFNLADQQVLTNWCTQSATYTDGTFTQTGTPGQPNVECGL